MNRNIAIAISASILIAGVGAFIYIKYYREFKPTAQSATEEIEIEINPNI